MFFYSNISTYMVYFIILQLISQASREKIRPAAETIAADHRQSQAIAALPGASPQIAADRRQCVPGVTPAAIVSAAGRNFSGCERMFVMASKKNIIYFLRI